jgi:hypothetical protein
MRADYLQSIDDDAEDRPLGEDEADGLIRFLRAYPY